MKNSDKENNKNKKGIKEIKKIYDKKRKRINITLDDKEYKKIITSSKIHQLKPAVYVKKSSLNFDNEKLINEKEYQRIKTQIHKIGVNVNQITKTINTYRSTLDNVKIEREISEILKQLNKLLEQYDC